MRPTRCASTSPGTTARRTSCWPSPARPTGSSLRRAGRGALRQLAGRGGEPAAAASRGTGSFQAILRADDQQQTVVGVVRRPSPGERRPLRRPAAGDHPRRPHRLAALLDADRPRPRRRRRAFLPGLQPGRRVLHLPELRARVDPGQPRPDRRGLPDGDGRGPDRARS